MKTPALLVAMLCMLVITAITPMLASTNDSIDLQIASMETMSDCTTIIEAKDCRFDTSLVADPPEIGPDQTAHYVETELDKSVAPDDEPDVAEAAENPDTPSKAKSCPSGNCPQASSSSGSGRCRSGWASRSASDAVFPVMGAPARGIVKFRQANKERRQARREDRRSRAASRAAARGRC